MREALPAPGDGVMAASLQLSGFPSPQTRTYGVYR